MTPGLKTSEGRFTLLAILVPLILPVVRALLARAGLDVELDPGTVNTALLANAGVASSYAVGRSWVKGKALE